MKRCLILFMAAAVVAILASPAGAGTTTSIDGHFKETYPKSGPPNCFTGSPCGQGQLKPYGRAAETFTFEDSDGFDANGCELLHGTDIITLADAQQSSFTEREYDTSCHPGSSHTVPGHSRSYGNPSQVTGSWTYLPGTGTGVFTSLCGGSGDVTVTFAGSTGVVDYTGTLTSC